LKLQQATQMKKSFHDKRFLFSFFLFGAALTSSSTAFQARRCSDPGERLGRRVCGHLKKKKKIRKNFFFSVSLSVSLVPRDFASKQARL
jgi:hypothetical protein